jgi:hypothetical protein
MKGFDYGREILKWLAIITMTIDHVGAILYTELDVLRWIGRLAFPLFAYLLILGMEDTRNVRNYFVRLFAFALISQVPFFLAIDHAPFDLFNIFFTLASGLVFIYYFKKGSLFAFVPVVISIIVPFDYGIYGIALIGCMYILRNDTRVGVASLILLNLLFLFPLQSQILSLVAIPFIVLHKTGYLSIIKKNEGKFSIPLWRKYFFYAYYPIHLVILYVIRVTYF